MAGRSGDTFKKRQKEVARVEKAREKFARRLQRKSEKPAEEVASHSDDVETSSPAQD